MGSELGLMQRRVGVRRGAAERVVAIIGAGFSGTMAAIHLRRSLPPDHVVYLFDRSGRFARGPAYAASEVPHLLNVRSVNMSALPDEPGHFENWLATQALPDEVRVTEAGTFATRRIYGRYLRALLYQEMTLSGGRVRLCADEVMALARVGDGWRLRCASGREVAADAVVIAAGNLPSNRPGDGVVMHDPWTAGATAGLRPDEAVLVIGTGLTMVDLALGMHARGFAGPIVAVSRRGLVPRRHEKPGGAWTLAPPAPGEAQSVLRLLRFLRRQVRDAARQGVGWRGVIDALRPITTQLWQGLPTAERERFLRHLRPYWDVHRHRMAPDVADAFEELMRRGVLRLQRGRVKAIETESGPRGRTARIVMQDRGGSGTRTMTVQRVIYATGTGAGAADDSLIATLIAGGVARPDRHGMGLDVTDALAVIDRSGAASANLWALGPIVRGIFWECTAVPDIRLQARQIASEIARQVARSQSAGG